MYTFGQVRQRCVGLNLIPHVYMNNNSISQYVSVLKQSRAVPPEVAEAETRARRKKPTVLDVKPECV